VEHGFPCTEPLHHFSGPRLMVRYGDRELKSRWARLYGLRTAMVETETALQKLMNELHASGEALIEDIDRRFARAQDLEALLRAQGGASGLPTLMNPVRPWRIKLAKLVGHSLSPTRIHCGGD